MLTDILALATVWVSRSNARAIEKQTQQIVAAIRAAQPPPPEPLGPQPVMEVSQEKRREMAYEHAMKRYRKTKDPRDLPPRHLMPRI